MSDHEHGEHTHEHGEHTHAHEPEPTYEPQAVPMSTRSALVPLKDGSDRVVTTFNSVNGQWVVFFDRDGAIEYAKTLLALAHTPPKESTERPPETVEVEVPDALTEPITVLTSDEERGTAPN